MNGEHYFQTVEKPRLSHEVARQIAQAIEEGRFLPGELLPPARELAKRLDVSRPILQEALSILQIQGFVSIRHGRGVTVKDPIKDILNVPVKDWLKQNLKLVENFYEARLAIEPICAARAAELGTDEEIQFLQDLLTRVEPLFHGSSASMLVGPDIDFHNKIAEMSRNEFLQKMLSSLIVPETDVRKIVLRLPSHQETTHQDHLRIVSAISNRNLTEAKKAMEIALSRPLHAVRAYLKEEDDTS